MKEKGRKNGKTVKGEGKETDMEEEKRREG